LYYGSHLHAGGRDQGQGALRDARRNPARHVARAQRTKDLEKVPEGAKHKLEFAFLENVDDALRVVLDPVAGGPSPNRQSASPAFLG